MAYYTFQTKNQIRAERIRYNLAQLTEEQAAFCMSEAKRLQAMGLDVTDNSLDSWVDCIAENMRIMNDHRRAQYCAEMGDC